MNVICEKCHKEITVEAEVFTLLNGTQFWGRKCPNCSHVFHEEVENQKMAEQWMRDVENANKKYRKEPDSRTWKDCISEDIDELKHIENGLKTAICHNLKTPGKFYYCGHCFEIKLEDETVGNGE